MALNQVYIPPEPVKKGGGGLLGAIGTGLGGLASLAGLAAAPFTGGASLGLTAAGAATKGVVDTIGAAQKVAGAVSTVGALADPKQADSGGQQRAAAQQVETAAAQKLKQDPRAVVAQLNDSMAALKNSSEKTQQALMPFFQSAYEKASKMIG